ncbi:SAV_6107 family HEPN domain-containing protein [Kytococcus sp. Marseille-QA3725]
MTTMTGAPTATIGVGAPAGTVLDLMERARTSLAEACASPVPEERYEAAHLAALRAAAAVVAARSVPGRASRPRSVWELLGGVAPELREWAVFFDGSARRRAALARGRQCSQREADDLVRQVDEFEQRIRGVLGLPVLPSATALLVAGWPVEGR